MSCARDLDIAGLFCRCFLLYLESALPLCARSAHFTRDQQAVATNSSRGHFLRTTTELTLSLANEKGQQAVLYLHFCRTTA